MGGLPQYYHLYALLNTLSAGKENFLSQTTNPPMKSDEANNNNIPILPSNIVSNSNSNANTNSENGSEKISPLSNMNQNNNNNNNNNSMIQSLRLPQPNPSLGYSTTSTNPILQTHQEQQQLQQRHQSLRIPLIPPQPPLQQPQHQQLYYPSISQVAPTAPLLTQPLSQQQQQYLQDTLYPQYEQSIPNISMIDNRYQQQQQQRTQIPNSQTTIENLPANRQSNPHNTGIASLLTVLDEDIEGGGGEITRKKIKMTDGFADLSALGIQSFGYVANDVKDMDDRFVIICLFFYDPYSPTITALNLWIVFAMWMIAKRPPEKMEYKCGRYSRELE